MKLVIQEKYTYDNTFVPSFTTFDEYVLDKHVYKVTYQNVDIEIPVEICFITESYEKKTISEIVDENTFVPENGDWNKFYKEELGIDQKENDYAEHSGDPALLNKKK